MKSYFAHESSTIDDGAEIGADTKIWHYCHVSAGAVIGQGCTLGQNVYVAPGVEIGQGSRIQNNVSIFEGVSVDDYVFLGPSMVFTNVKAPRAAFPVQRPRGFARTRVGYGATIGANATVVCGVTIGKWALIGAGAVVTRDVPDHALVVGVPGVRVGWACSCGARLQETEGAAACAACSRRYTISGADHVELLDRDEP